MKEAVNEVKNEVVTVHAAGNVNTETGVVIGNAITMNAIESRFVVKGLVLKGSESMQGVTNLNCKQC